MAAYVGIDTGKDGAICFLLGDREPFALTLRLTPTIPKGKGSGRLYDVPSMARMIQDSAKAANLFVAIERGTAMRGQGVTSMFSFGRGCGIWEGIIAALEIPHVLVRPQEWHKVICKGITGGPKARSFLAATRTFPTVDFRKSDRAKKPHSGMTDATCLALYARHHFFGDR